MTDDTLRIECAPMIDRICYTVTLPENAGRPDRVEAAIADMLLAFARAQQAKGMKEALRMVDEQRAEDSRRWALFRCEVKAQAAVREQAQVPYPGWCRQPDQCQGKSSCPLDPTCAD